MIFLSFICIVLCFLFLRSVQPKILRNIVIVGMLTARNALAPAPRSQSVWRGFVRGGLGSVREVWAGFRSVWGNVWGIWGSHLGRFGVDLGKIWGACNALAQALRCQSVWRGFVWGGMGSVRGGLGKFREHLGWIWGSCGSHLGYVQQTLDSAQNWDLQKISTSITG